MTDSLSQTHVIVTATEHVLVLREGLQDYLALPATLTTNTCIPIQVYQVFTNQSSAVCSGYFTGFLRQL